MATFPLITANDDQFPAVWHVGTVEVPIAIGWNTSIHSSTNTAVATNEGTEDWNLT